MNYPWILAKTAIIYFVLILILRFLGKREVGQLSIFDLVIILIIADVASIGIDNDEFFFASIFCLILLAVLQKLFSYLLLIFPSLRGIADGNPSIIVYNGELNIKNMKKEMYTIDDLVSQMRIEHISDLSEIKLAVLETSGSLSVVKNKENTVEIMPVILSGKIENDYLECIGISKEKIIECLKRNKLELKRILYASASFENLYVYISSKNKASIGCRKLQL